MFISKLIQIIEGYDPYGLYRLNGIRMLFILIIMFLFNIILDLKSPYFYYFYLPLTIMSIELTAATTKERYKLFLHTIIHTLAFVLILNMLRPYTMVFLFFAFIAASSLYLMALNKKHLTLGAVSTILSLAAYSLNYPSLNNDLNSLLNNIITTLIASLIILGAIILFPLSYYYRLWLRSLHLLLKESLEKLISNHNQQTKLQKPINYHAIQLSQFTKLLPNKIPLYTITKINLLSHQLHTLCFVTNNKKIQFQTGEYESLLEGINNLINAIEQEKPCELTSVNHKVLHKLINSWNRLCLI